MSRSPTIAIVAITLNEAHNMEAFAASIEELASEVFILDSYSEDDTINIALSHGFKVFQRRFTGFGAQWNYAINELPITADWTMKLDPDERITPELCESIKHAIHTQDRRAYSCTRRLWFMGKPMPVRQKILRVWRTGTAKFSDVLVNEHPLTDDPVELLVGEMEHHDSPNLEHWFNKQNKYSTMEATTRFQHRNFAEMPRVFGSTLQRRMWLKQIYPKVPFRHQLMFLYCYLGLGAWRAGKEGFLWAKLRSWVFQIREMKLGEMHYMGHGYNKIPTGNGAPHPKASQCDGADR